MLDFKKTVIWCLGVALLALVFIVTYQTGVMHGRCRGREEVIMREHSRIVRTDSLLRKQTETVMVLVDRLYGEGE